MKKDYDKNLAMESIREVMDRTGKRFRQVAREFFEIRRGERMVAEARKQFLKTK